MSRSPDSHEDALALFRAVLADPDDVTPRLVFADWLEDTGRPANVALAEYLRLHTIPGIDRPDRAHLLSELTPRIKARLTLSAGMFCRHGPLVLALLPAERVTVRLPDFRPDRSVIEAVPESVVRESFAVPLAVDGGRIFFAASSVEPMTRERLAFILIREVEFVLADGDEVQALIDACYGQTETESAEVSYDSPAMIYELGYGPLFQALYNVFFRAFSEEWTDLLVRRGSGSTTVEYQNADRSSEPEQHPGEVYELLLNHLLNLPALWECVQSPGYSSRIVEVPMSSGRTRRWTLICDGVPPAAWYLIRRRDDRTHMVPHHFERPDFELL